MDPEEQRKFGGPRELNGAVDLISHYRLSAHHDFFCKRPLPAAICDTHYLHNVVGDTEIRRGEGMELDQLVRTGLYSRLKDTASSHIRQFDLETLGQAFQLRETTPVDLPTSDKGTPTISGKSKSSSKDKDKEKKHKKHKDKDREKDKEHKKHKHRHKDKDRSKDKERDKDKDRKKDRNSQPDSGGDHSKKHHDKKRKHDSIEDSAENHKHKRSKAPELDSR